MFYNVASTEIVKLIYINKFSTDVLALNIKMYILYNGLWKPWNPEYQYHQKLVAIKYTQFWSAGIMKNIKFSFIDTDPKNSKQNKRPQLDEVPRIVIFNVEHDKMIIAKRIEWTKNKSSS